MSSNNVFYSHDHVIHIYPRTGDADVKIADLTHPGKGEGSYRSYTERTIGKVYKEDTGWVGELDLDGTGKSEKAAIVHGPTGSRIGAAQALYDRWVQERGETVLCQAGCRNGRPKPLMPARYLVERVGWRAGEYVREHQCEGCFLDNAEPKVIIMDLSPPPEGKAVLFREDQIRGWLVSLVGGRGRTSSHIVDAIAPVQERIKWTEGQGAALWLARYYAEAMAIIDKDTGYLSLAGEARKYEEMSQASLGLGCSRALLRHKENGTYVVRAGEGMVMVGAVEAKAHSTEGALVNLLREHAAEVAQSTVPPRVGRLLPKTGSPDAFFLEGPLTPEEIHGVPVTAEDWASFLERVEKVYRLNGKPEREARVDVFGLLLGERKD